MRSASTGWAEPRRLGAEPGIEGEPGGVLRLLRQRGTKAGVATLFLMRYVPSGWLGLDSARTHVWSALPLHVHVTKAAPSWTLELPPATLMQRWLPSVL